MESKSATPYTIVVGLDFRDAGGYAFEQAALTARAVPLSHLHLVHVGEPLDAVTRKQLIGQLRLYVNEKAAALGGFGGLTVGIHLRAGEPAREIARLASEVSANLIVIGAHKGPSLKSWLLGRVSEHLLLSAPCPVLIAGPPQPAAHRDPTIEPPCTDCIRTRTETKGVSWWCDRHHHHAAKAHVFSYQRELPLATHDSEVIPTGVEFK
jgi:nucleotide-binding universal stress UspA family protein